MFAFKIVVSTLLLLLMGITAYAGITSPKGKWAALIMFTIDALSIIAIWG